MSQSPSPVLVGRRRVPWAVIPPLLVALLAAGLWLSGQFSSAPSIDKLSATIQSNPNDAQAYADRGLAYASLNNFQNAIADYTKALELAPETADAPIIYNNRGLAYFRSDQDEQALADYNRAIELKSDYAVAYVNRALLHQRQEKTDLAIADYTKALEVDPQIAQAYIGRGQVHADAGNADQALADFSKAIELDNKLAAAYNGRADIYLARGESDKAMTELRAVVANAGPEDDLLKTKAQSQLDALLPPITPTANP